MSVNLSTVSVEIREDRLKTIISYSGTANDLNEKSKQLKLRLGRNDFTQCNSCQQGCAEGMCSMVRGSATVVHAPIGCYAPDVGRHIQGNSVAKVRNLGSFDSHTICTNITENDTIYGGTSKLRTAVFEIYKRHHPKVIFITTSCASGIIGDDIESVAREAEDELGIKVVPIFCEGFKSKIWNTGRDAVFHGVLRDIVKPAQKKQEDLVNVFNFEGVDTFSPLLAKLNLRVNYLLPMATVEQLETISEAACTTEICETLSSYGAGGLEEIFGVPKVKSPSPYGLSWTDAWLREIARYTHREEIAEKVIREEHERIQAELDELRNQLKGVTVFVFAGDTYAHNLANMAKDLGVELIGMNTMHRDQKADTQEINTLENLVNSVGDIPNFSVCNIQPYRVAKIIKRLKPDILLTRHMGLYNIGTKLGIPSVPEGDANYSIAYDGIIKLGRRLLLALQTKSLVENLSEHAEFPYTDWWLNRKEDIYQAEGEDEE